MGTLSLQRAPYLLLTRFPVGGRREFTCLRVQDKERALDAASRPEPGSESWAAAVFFDHIEGLNPRVPEKGPVYLVRHIRNWDYGSPGQTIVDEYQSVPDLIREAERSVAQEKRAGPGTSELWEVYGVWILNGLTIAK